MVKGRNWITSYETKEKRYYIVSGLTEKPSYIKKVLPQPIIDFLSSPADQIRLFIINDLPFLLFVINKERIMFPVL